LKEFLQTRKFKLWVAWLFVFLCALAIFLVVPLARRIQTFVSDHWGRALFGYAVLLAVGVAFILILYLLIFRFKIRSPSNFLWLAAVTVLYVYFILKLWSVPEEAVHFLEYGLLGFFLFRALKFHFHEKCIYFIAFLSGSLVGIFDEILQWMVPLRYWDIRDVGLNALSSALFQIALWKGIKPKTISPKIRIKSIKVISILFGINLILLGLCLSNTPQRVASYSKICASLSFLKKEEVMNRFRHKIKDSDIGQFYSLLKVEELRRQDKEKTMVNVIIIKEWKDKKFKEFRRHYSSLDHPFLYELRAHLELRNRSMAKGQIATSIRDKKNYFLAAYKENLILEKYFGHTLKKASGRWNKRQLLQISSLIDKNQPYSSPMSFGATIPFSEFTVWITIAAFLMIIIALNILLTKRVNFNYSLLKRRK